jgi:hypothetical protein
VKANTAKPDQDADGQRKQVIEAKDRNQVYSRIVTLRQINAAGLANHEVRRLLLKSEIFIPAELGPVFS